MNHFSYGTEAWDTEQKRPKFHKKIFICKTVYPIQVETTQPTVTF